MRGQPLPSIDEVADLADEALVLLQYCLDQLLKHAADHDRRDPGDRRTAQQRRAAAQPSAEQPRKCTATDQDQHALGEALPAAQHFEQFWGQRDKDRAQRHKANQDGQYRQRQTGNAAGEHAGEQSNIEPLGASRHQAGAGRD